MISPVGILFGCGGRVYKLRVHLANEGALLGRIGKMKSLGVFRLGRKGGAEDKERPDRGHHVGPGE